MTAALAAVDGVTRAEAHKTYMRALAELVTWVVATTTHLRLTPDYEIMARKVGAPHPAAFSAVAMVQAREWYAGNPRHLRSIELVAG